MSLIDWHVSVAARESRFPSLSHIYIFSIFSTIGRRLITIEIGSRVATTPPPPPSSPPPLYLDSRDSFAAPFGLRCAHIKVHCHTYSLITMVWVNELQTARVMHVSYVGARFRIFLLIPFRLHSARTLMELIFLH